MRYNARQFDLSGLTGISDKTLEMHFKLYEGYVTQTNGLVTKLTELNKDGAGVDEKRMAEYSELKRRLGFEYNGMVLHELYFGRPEDVRPLEGELAEEVTGLLASLGHTGPDALETWMGGANLETRATPDGIDGRVLEELRREASAG